MGIGGANKKSVGKGYRNLWCREVGILGPRSFADRVRASEDLVLRLGFDKLLEKHTGSVTALSFSGDGNILVSGSGDEKVVLWDWDAGEVKFSFHSGHRHNVLQAKFMPNADKQTMVTCGVDGKVRYAQLMEGGSVSTTKLARHVGGAHKIAIDPTSLHTFYSCGEDGAVLQFDMRRRDVANRLFKCRSLKSTSCNVPIVKLFAMGINPTNPNILAVAGSDENARIYDVRKSIPYSGQPDCLFSHPNPKGKKGISSLVFSRTNELLASYSDDSICLFSWDQSVRSESAPQVYEGHASSPAFVTGSFFGPNYEYVVSGSVCGNVFIWRKSDGMLLRAMNGGGALHTVTCIEPHPSATLIASSGLERPIKIWAPNLTEPASPINLKEIDKAFWSESDFDEESDGDDIHGHDEFDDLVNF